MEMITLPVWQVHALWGLASIFGLCLVVVFIVCVLGK